MARKAHEKLGAVTYATLGWMQEKKTQTHTHLYNNTQSQPLPRITACLCVCARHTSIEVIGCCLATFVSCKRSFPDVSGRWPDFDRMACVTMCAWCLRAKVFGISIHKRSDRNHRWVWKGKMSLNPVGHGADTTPECSKTRTSLKHVWSVDKCL